MNYLQFSLAILHFFQTTFDFNPHLLVLLRGIGMSSCAVLYLPCQTTCHIEPTRFAPNGALTIEWNKKQNKEEIVHTISFATYQLVYFWLWHLKNLSSSTFVQGQ